MYPNGDTKTYTQKKASGARSGGFVALLAEQPLVFGGLWAGLFLVLFSTAWMLDIVPKLDTDDEPTVTVEETAPVVVADESGTPTRIIIDALGLDATITNPTSTDIEVLDAALLEGVVRYPGSGNLNEHANVFLFGHSTGFRVVQNEAFKVFNDLKKLQKNDLIRVQSATHEYVYRVTSVSLANADEVFVDLSKRARKLTLSTCNSFGDKQERYVVEADFVGSYTLSGGAVTSIDF